LMTLCKCGCGQEIIKKPHHKYSGIPRFIRGHQTPESRRKTSELRKGNPLSEETKRKMRKAKKKYEDTQEEGIIWKWSETKKRNPSWNKGKHLSEKHKQNISISRNKILQNPECRDKICSSMSSSHKKLWQNPEFKEKMINAIMKGLQIKPNKPEQIIIDLINKYNLPYKYVGDGQFILGGKCPDFINVDGQKKLIELYGDFWHQGENPQNRIDYFKQFGFDTLIIWEHELNDIDAVLDRIIGL